MYGAAVRTGPLREKNQFQFSTETYNPTMSNRTEMDGEMGCPNGAKLTTNRDAGGTKWDERWLRASTPPKPPSYIPTDYIWRRPRQQ